MDGGIKSRKLWFSIFAMLLVIATAFMSTKGIIHKSLYPEVSDALVALAAIYLGGNVAGKFFASKLPKDKDKP